MRFFRTLEKLNIDDQIQEVLFRLFFQNKVDRYIYARDLAAEANIRLDVATDLLRELASAGVVIMGIITCESCGEEVEFAEECPNCKEPINIYEKCYVRVPGVLLGPDKRSFFDKVIGDQNAQYLVDTWERNGFIIYIIMDLVNSQKVQQVSDVEYNGFLIEIRRLLREKVLSQLNGFNISLGEIGDCYKLVLENPADILILFQEFARNLPSIGDRFPSIKTDVPIFPKYSASVQMLPKPKDARDEFIHPKNVVNTTLNGQVDINEGKLTDFFRLESVASLKYEIFSDCEIAAWFFQEVMEKINLHPSQDALYHISIMKNEIISEGSAGLITFSKEHHAIISNPSEYLKK